MIPRGVVVGARGGFVSVSLPGVRVGDGVSIAALPRTVCGHVCAVDAHGALVAVHCAIGGVACGTPVRFDPAVERPVLGTCALGRAVDARGQPLDGGTALSGTRIAVPPALPAPSDRRPVREPFATGIRAIDGLLTFGRGARIGVFGAPGAGKSTLLEHIVAGCRADAVVVGLIGERGREAQQWIDARRAHWTIVCATSDCSAAERARAALVSAAQAAALRERGLHVLLVLDSLARVAGALREVAIGTGESVGRGGYPPSVFAELARLVEIAGPTRAGSMTLIASVIDDGDDRDPVSDAARALLDGHLALSSQLAQAGRFPAIDVPASTSRTMRLVTQPGHRHAAECVRSALTLLEQTEDARRIGIEPADAPARRAIAAESCIRDFLQQGEQPTAFDATLDVLSGVATALND